ncbi:type II secretion system F family protein [Sneathiella chinensis]|uniref:Type II secretion system protein n=1 Tax=Sneathiella chinensis TaxID=349750 RepID=A0ABQ5U5H5_9PROT|nr:type II secretion system F family protein [Sneathiella chinensis]GLQ06567.1 type II secretion system protein [Sneathiella chinensis]
MDITTLLPGWMKSEDIMAIVAGIAAMVVFLMIWNALLVKDSLPERIKSLEKRRSKLKAEAVAETRQRSQLIARENLMHRVVKKMKLMRGEKARQISARLAQAGWRSKDALVTYLFARIALPVVVGLFAVIYCVVQNPFDWPLSVGLMVSLGAALFGYSLPGILLKNQISKRYALIRKALPDALDLLVICTEAGLNLDSGLDRVCREIANSAPELSDEFGLTSIELGFLPDRKEALGNLAKRVDFQAMTTLVNTLLQTEKYGTPLAVALRVLSAEMRDERLMKAEEKAARLPAIMTVPMIVFILPALFIVLIGPAVLKAIDAFSGS